VEGDISRMNIEKHDRMEHIRYHSSDRRSEVTYLRFSVMSHHLKRYYICLDFCRVQTRKAPDNPFARDFVRNASKIHPLIEYVGAVSFVLLKILWLLLDYEAVGLVLRLAPLQASY